MASQIVREETLCRHMGYSFRLTARVLSYAEYIVEVVIVVVVVVIGDSSSSSSSSDSSRGDISSSSNSNSSSFESRYWLKPKSKSTK